MSAVLVYITIPSKEFESKLTEDDKYLDSVKRPKSGNNRSELQTITETNENLNNEIKNKFNDSNEQLLETIVEDALSYLGIDDAVWQKSKTGNYYGISFAVDLEDSDAVLQYFKSNQIGSKLCSSIGLIPFSYYCYDEETEPYDEFEANVPNEKEGMRKLSKFKTEQNKFLKSVTARLTVAQVVDNVRSGAELTFDFICYVIFAAWIAAMGLLDNSVVSLVASMLVSPMMGPVMAMTFGTIIKDGSLRRLGLKNLGVCFLMCIMFGYIFGIIALNFTEHWNADQEWPTNMMRERGLPRVVWVGTLVAFPSGCAVAISLLAGNEASLVGVAISVSLLPPAVNTGLLWAFSTLRTIYSIGEEPTDTYYEKRNYTNLRPSLTPQDDYTPFFNDNLAIEAAILGCFSTILSLINITNIFIGALILLKIKEIAPLSTMSPNTRRFFQEDLRIVREYNAEHGGSNENMGEQVLKEWAVSAENRTAISPILGIQQDITGIDASELLARTPEARATQYQTLNDIVRDVEADEVYQSVTRTKTSANNNTDMILRRMSGTLFQPPASAGYASYVNPAFVRDGRRRSSQNSLNTSNFRLSGVEMAAIAHRRKNGRRGSRLSQLTPTYYGPDGDVDLSSMPSHPSTPTHHNHIKMPLSAGVAPINANVFTFGDPGLRNDINRHSNRLRRNSQLLRRSLRQTDHSPYSLWPTSRLSPNIPRFVVTPVSETTVPEIKIDPN